MSSRRNINPKSKITIPDQVPVGQINFSETVVSEPTAKYKVNDSPIKFYKHNYGAHHERQYLFTQ